MAELGDDITMEQAMVLAFIDEQKNTTDMIQQDIAEVMDKNKSAILRTVDQLEKKGFAKRLPVPNDRRKNRLVITEQGVKVVENVKKMIGKKEAVIRNQFTEKELAAFFKILATIRNLQ